MEPVSCKACGRTGDNELGCALCSGIDLRLEEYRDAPDHSDRFLPGWWIIPFSVVGLVIWLAGLIGLILKAVELYLVGGP